MALSQSTLDASQIELILSSKGLQGEILKTTTDEIANVASTKAMANAQRETTTSTIEFEKAIKGTGASLKQLALAHPYLLAITAIITGITVWGKIVDKQNEEFNKNIKSVSEWGDTYQDATNKLKSSQSELQELKNEISDTTAKISELQSQVDAGTISISDENELENLKLVNEQLERKIALKKQQQEDDIREALNDAKNGLTVSEDKENITNFGESWGDFGFLGAIVDGFVDLGDKLHLVEDKYKKNIYNLEDRFSDNIDFYNNIQNKDNILKNTTKYNELISDRDAIASVIDYYNQLKSVGYVMTDSEKKQYDSLSSLMDKYYEFNYSLHKTIENYKLLNNESKKRVIQNNLESNGFSQDQIDNILKNINDDDLDSFYDIKLDFDIPNIEDYNGNIEDWAKAFVQKWKKNVSQELSNNTSNYASDFKSLNDSLSSLTDNAELLSKVNKEISNTGIISAENLKKINEAFPEDKYPELTKSLYEYQLGLISTTELFDELEKCYNQDANLYAEKNYNKLETTNEFLDKVRIEYPDFFNYLSDLYQDDLGNYENIAELKKEIDTTLVSALNNLWANHYELVQDKVTGLYSAIVDDQAMLDGTISEEGSDAILNGISDEVERANSALSRLQQIKDSYVNQISTDNSWNALSMDSSSSSSSSQTEQDVDWIERLINKISTAYSRLKNVVSDTTTTWLNRNNALSDSMNTLADEINAQSDAYEYYMNAFNSYGLDDYYKNQIADGSISIDVIYDDDLKNAISDCQDFYDKAQDAKTAVQELNIELKGLAKSRFDNVASEFENELKEFENKLTELQNENTLLEAQGYVNSENSFNRMLDNEKSRMNKLSDEYNSLIAKRDEAVSAGNIKKYSEDWYTMQSEIDSVANSIADCKKNLADFSKELKQLSWDKFDLGQEYISDFISETEFLESLIEKNYDDSGNITPEGQANMALHIQGYQSYKKQAEAYSTEITKINKDLANDPNNTTLINRKRELIKSQQEAIKSYKDEQKSIKDLVSEGFESYKNSLDEIIQKYKDMLSTSKDLYDYQKNIKEQTDNINSLNKRILANSGDNSEEAKKISQQLKVELNKANDELNETEYEKLISDTEKLLDDLSDEVKTIFDKRIDNIDADFDKLIDSVDSNVPGIYGTIKELADSVGYNMSNSMNDMIDFSLKGNDTLSSIALTLNNIYAYVGDIYKQANNLTQKGWNLDANGNYTYTDNKGNIVKNDWIKDSEKWYHMGSSGTMDKDTWIHNDSGTWSYIDSKGKAIDTGWSQINGKWYNFNENGTMRSMDWIHNNDDTWSYVGAEGDAQVGWSQIAGKWYYFDENGVMASNKWIGDYFFKRNGEMASNTWIGHNGKYYWVDSNGQWKDITGWTLNNKPDDGLPLYQYKNGTKYAHGGISLTDEDGLGSEAIVTKYGVLRQLDSGDTVFNKEQVQQLWNMSKGITPNMGLSNIISKLPDIPVNSKSMSNKVDISYGDVTLTFPNVHNYEDIMKQMQKDPKAEKMIQEMTLGQTLGRNSLNKLTFR